MLTPAQIRAHEFASAGRGAYRSIDVDEYLGKVAESVEAITQEKNEYLHRVTSLTEQVEAYQKEEGNISAALLTAQKMAASLTDDAQTKAQEAVATAESTAKETLEKATAEAQEMLAAAKSESGIECDGVAPFARMTVLGFVLVLMG